LGFHYILPILFFWLYYFNLANSLFDENPKQSYNAPNRNNSIELLHVVDILMKVINSWHLISASVHFDITNLSIN